MMPDIVVSASVGGFVLYDAGASMSSEDMVEVGYAAEVKAECAYMNITLE